MSTTLPRGFQNIPTLLRVLTSSKQSAVHSAITGHDKPGSSPRPLRYAPYARSPPSSPSSQGRPLRNRSNRQEGSQNLRSTASKPSANARPSRLGSRSRKVHNQPSPNTSRKDWMGTSHVHISSRLCLNRLPVSSPRFPDLDSNVRAGRAKAYGFMIYALSRTFSRSYLFLGPQVHPFCLWRTCWRHRRFDRLMRESVGSQARARIRS
ncbi:hypothetical protein V8E55_002702 [Tylopilus felleus]